MEQGESKKTVRTLGLSSFFNDLGSDMINPVWPLFLTGVLGANMAVVGFIDGLGEALVSLSQALSGYLSDRFRKRKLFIWLGYSFPIVARAGYALATSWQSVIPFKVLDRAGKIRGAPRDAMIADVSTHANRGTHFGFRKMMDHLGAVCGILACLALFNFLGYRNLFLIAALPSLAAAGLVIFFIREKPAKQAVYEGFSFRLIDRNFTLLLAMSSVFALGAFSYSFLLIYAQKAGFAITTIPVLYLVFTVAASVSALPFGKLSDSIGRKPVLAISFFLWIAVCAGLIFFQTTAIISLAFVLYGFHKASLDTVQTTFASELCPVKYRASSLGALQMIIGLCALPASLIAGMLWDRINIAAPFYFSLALTVIAFILLTLIDDRACNDGVRS